MFGQHAADKHGDDAIQHAAGKHGDDAIRAPPASTATTPSARHRRAQGDDAIQHAGKHGDDAVTAPAGKHGDDAIQHATGKHGDDAQSAGGTDDLPGNCGSIELWPLAQHPGTVNGEQVNSLNASVEHAAIAAPGQFRFAARRHERLGGGSGR